MAYIAPFCWMTMTGSHGERSLLETLRSLSLAGWCWHTPLISLLWRQRQAKDQPGLQNEFQHSQGYTVTLPQNKTEQSSLSLPTPLLYKISCPPLALWKPKISFIHSVFVLFPAWHLKRHNVSEVEDRRLNISSEGTQKQKTSVDKETGVSKRLAIGVAGMLLFSYCLGTDATWFWVSVDSQAKPEMEVEN